MMNRFLQFFFIAVALTFTSCSKKGALIKSLPPGQVKKTTAPGQVKKVTGSKSAKPYAPGQQKKTKKSGH